MTETQSMLDLPSGFRSLFWPVAIVLAAVLALLWMTGYGPGGRSCLGTPVVAAAAPAAEPVAPAPAPAPAPADQAAAALPPIAKLYFDNNSAALGTEAKAKAAAVLAYLAAHPEAKAVLSGFHDPKGDKAANELLALNRARAVRGLLEEAGIAKDRVVMAKPVETTGDGTMAEARRVELSVQP